jgi:hypothetical protein
VCYLRFIGRKGTQRYLFLISGSDGKEERPAEEGAGSCPGGDILEQLHPVVPGRGQEVCYKKKLVFLVKTNPLSFKVLFIAVHPYGISYLLSVFLLNAD